jgi:hypothetical protein
MNWQTIKKEKMASVAIFFVALGKSESVKLFVIYKHLNGVVGLTRQSKLPNHHLAPND